MADKPFITVQERSIFGEFNEDFVDNPNRDITELPGYSDKRREKELAIRKGEEVDPLPWRFQYVPNQRVSGAPTNHKIAEYKSKGYSLVQWDDASDYGIEVDDSGANRTPDGLVQLGDSVLMVCPGDVAAQHDYEQRRITAQRANPASSLPDRRDERGRPVFEFEEEDRFTKEH